jgi:hypothetical protein
MDQAKRHGVVIDGDNIQDKYLGTHNHRPGSQLKIIRQGRFLLDNPMYLSPVFLQKEPILDFFRTLVAMAVRL